MPIDKAKINTTCHTLPLHVSNRYETFRDLHGGNHIFRSMTRRYTGEQINSGNKQFYFGYRLLRDKQVVYRDDTITRSEVNRPK